MRRKESNQTNLTMPGYPHKASNIQYRLWRKLFSGDDRDWIIEINCTDNDYFLSDRVRTQTKKLKEDILVAFDGENVGWKIVYNFLGIDEKTLRNLLIFYQNVRTVYSYIRTVYPDKEHVTSHPGWATALFSDACVILK